MNGSNIIDQPPTTLESVTGTKQDTPPVWQIFSNSSKVSPNTDVAVFQPNVQGVRFSANDYENPIPLPSTPQLYVNHWSQNRNQTRRRNSCRTMRRGKQMLT